MGKKKNSLGMDGGDFVYLWEGEIRFDNCFINCLLRRSQNKYIRDNETTHISVQDFVDCTSNL